MNSIFYYLVAIHHQMPSLQGFKSLTSLCVFNFAFFYVLCFLAFKIHQKLLIWLQNFLVFVGILSGCISIFLILHFNSPITDSLVLIALNTNFNEIREFIYFYFDTKTLAILFVFVIGSFITLRYQKTFSFNTNTLTKIFVCNSIIILLSIVFSLRKGHYDLGPLLTKPELTRVLYIFHKTIIEHNKILTKYKEFNTILTSTRDELLSIRGG